MNSMTPSEASRMKGDKDMVSLEALSELTGFSVDMIKKEILNKSDKSDESISLGELREAMVSYLDAQFMVSE